MAKPQKAPNPAGLIAIANPNLAKKLNDDDGSETKKETASPKDGIIQNPALQITLDQDRWRAVFALNIVRYIFSLGLLGATLLPEVSTKLDFFADAIHPAEIRLCAIALLISAICFTLFTNTKRFELSHILIGQFTLDIVLSGYLVHATGSIGSNFSLLFFVVVTTGSVVLRRKQAIALASGATIILFYEHLYSFLKANAVVEARLGTLAAYCIILMTAAWMISYLARRLRHAELRSYIPGNESIEEYLVREEKVALKTALERTNGNKTEAAKLLGMTFRSFRYKLTKYDIG